MTKVYVGTTNNAKVNACREVLKEYEIVPLKLGKDRFYFSRNMDLLIDKEGERFNSLVGQQFYVETTDKIIPIGTLKRIKKFPELSFALQADDINALKNYLKIFSKQEKEQSASHIVIL